MCAVTVRPAVGAFSFWVSSQIKDFDFALPDGLAAKDLMDRHGFTPSRIRLVQMRNSSP